MIRCISLYKEEYKSIMGFSVKSWDLDLQSPNRFLAPTMQIINHAFLTPDYQNNINYRFKFKKLK